MADNGIIQIHGKSYMTVSKRLELAHEDKKIEGIKTEVLQHDPVVVIRATVKIGGIEYQATSSANPSKSIERSNPYEVAETSAVGRALGFANYGLMESVATADDMSRVVKHTENGETPSRQIDEEAPPFPDDGEIKPLACSECGATATLKSGNKNGKQWKGLFCSSGDRTHTKWLH